MPATGSDAEGFLVAVPMLAGLFMALFRLDEVISRPVSKPKRTSQLCRWDKNGVPVFVDPAGEASDEKSPASSTGESCKVLMRSDV